MTASRIAFIFPAFVRDYQDDKCVQIKGFTEHFSVLLRTASGIVDPELAYFHPKEQNFLDHELRTQYIAYIHGCAIADVLQAKGLVPAFLCGYSMGIYAALVEGGSISFETGLLLIRKAFQEISYTTMTERFGMAGVIGLPEEDIDMLLQKWPEVELVNRNSAFSVVFSGRLKDLENLLQAAKKEGAFHARMLNVTVPYHSHLLKSSALQFARFVYSVGIKCPKIPIISVLSQDLLDSPEDIRTELVENLYKHFNWFATHLKMLEMGMTTFIECGPGKSLAKNARFIPGNYAFLTPLKALIRNP